MDGQYASQGKLGSAILGTHAAQDVSVIQGLSQDFENGCLILPFVKSGSPSSFKRAHSMHCIQIVWSLIASIKNWVPKFVDCKVWDVLSFKLVHNMLSLQTPDMYLLIEIS